jgi:hypothetical protein
MTDRSRRIVILSAVLVLASCGPSYSPGLYSEGGETVGSVRPALIDGEIRMTTRWSASPDETPDVRVITCNQGLLSCSFENADGKREGFVRECDWNALWTRLEPVSPWASPAPTIKPQDPNGGPYHVIHLRAGSQASQFSSQHRADILVFTSREAADRLQYSNAIVDFVSARARMRVEVAPESRPTPSKP